MEKEEDNAKHINTRRFVVFEIWYEMQWTVRWTRCTVVACSEVMTENQNENPEIVGIVSASTTVRAADKNR